MSDRPSHGPVRRLSPVSADNRKPYSRTGLKGVLGTLDLNSGDTAVSTAPNSPYYPFHVETPQLEAPTQNCRSPPDGPRDVAGFPTYEQYQHIEEEYLSSLSDRKQPKALISQALFDKIFAVLQNGSEDRGSTAQFRFWVRKMFVLAYPQTSFNHNAGQTTEPVVLHDKRPVAIREQLYEVLCYCHAVARHGGRDKTCATLRLHYSWVPKELTAKFVKTCPTCTLKRSGNPDLLSQFGHTVHAPYAPNLNVPGAEPASGSLLPGGPDDSPPGLSSVVGPAGCDEGSCCGGCGGSGFGPSFFTTPDLSVYPSPTLSAGSLGPTTPSPYLPNGLFGYPAVFDPGHGSLSSVAGWDPSSLSPCVHIYAEDLHAATAEKQQQQQQSQPQHQHQPASADEIPRLRLPTPTAAPSMRTHARSPGDRHDGDTLQGMMGAPCLLNAGNIDPTLLMEGGYPSPFGLSLCTSPVVGMSMGMNMGMGMGPGSAPRSGSTDYRAPASTPGRQPPPPLPGMAAGSGRYSAYGEGVSPELLLPPPPAAVVTSQSPALRGVRIGGGGATSRPLSRAGRPPPPTTTMYAPVPVVPPTAAAAVVLRMEEVKNMLLCGCDGAPRQDAERAEAEATDGLDDAQTQTRTRTRMGMGTGMGLMERARGVEVEVESHHRLEDASWDSPEAWLVQSDSIEEALNAVV